MDSRFPLYFRLTGIEPKTQHQKILAVLLDGQWHLAGELHGTIIFWKAASRISELKAKGIDVGGREAENRVQWEYKLLTKWENIDLKRCELKCEPACEGPQSVIGSDHLVASPRQAGSKISLVIQGELL